MCQVCDVRWEKNTFEEVHALHIHKHNGGKLITPVSGTPLERGCLHALVDLSGPYTLYGIVPEGFSARPGAPCC
jgi:hypothetical protein